MKKILLGGAVIVVAAILFVWLGVYNIAADSPHLHPTYLLLQKMRERSIAVRAAKIDVPSLENPASVRKGAGNYDSMCTGCHLAPGMKDSEMSVGLYPAPPNLSKVQLDPAKAFWVIKHGIKASGMPAWGKRMEDSYIWDIVAFLRKLPAMTAEQYAAEVASGSGHTHGGGETMNKDAVSKDTMDKDTHDKAAMPAHSEESSSKTARPPTTKDNAKATAVAAAHAFHKALTSGDARTLKELLDPDVLIMESGHVERSRQEYSAHHLASDLKFMKSITYKLERESGDAVGDLAWVTSESRLTGTANGEPIDTLSMETLVLKKSAAGWKVMHIHWSSRPADKK